jgi:crotonobetainyl-CoA:carnitine CoA-transferase CaiB-like acyl-CoA transferase
VRASFELPPLDKGGYARHLSRDRRPYKTSDGFISVIVYNDKQWENFFKATGRDDLSVNHQPNGCGPGAESRSTRQVRRARRLP